ncbi:reverse transcriptase family protein, partial [Jatrophihabitans endophyticus]|uniref:RNA-directed DNA polymerase n=1 Tax=Jatrophihabitans endophyticus TaxID=1206085 RepID=UPI0019E82929
AFDAAAAGWSDKILAVGDKNARTGVLQTDCARRWTRKSQDDEAVVDRRGHRLLDLLGRHGLGLLDGTAGTTDGDNGGRPTSFGSGSRTKIDYAAVATAHREVVLDFAVLPPLPHSDHAPLLLTLRKDLLGLGDADWSPRRRPRAKRLAAPALREGRQADAALQELLDEVADAGGPPEKGAPIDVEAVLTRARETDFSSTTLTALRKEIERLAIEAVQGDKVQADAAHAKRKPLLKALRQRLADKKRARQQATLSALLSARRHGAYFEMLKKLRQPARRPSKVQLDDLRRHFEGLLTGKDSQFFDHVELLRAEMEDLARPANTLSADTPDALKRPFTADEVAAKLKKRVGGANTPGADGIDNKTLRKCKPDSLARLFNIIAGTREAPSPWLLAVLAAIPKSGASINEASNSRGIALMSCLLKLFMALISDRYWALMTERGIKPPSQNGFVPGLATTNNPKSLRYVAERAAADGRDLYVAYLDLSKAFDLVHRPTLWAKMEKMGFSGPLFDVVRSVYAEMRFCVRFDGETSPPFEATHGVMQGCTLSPTLWVLFMADFALEPHADDPQLDGVRVPQLEHADDTVVMSHSPAGLQRHLDAFGRWCARNGAIPNPAKSCVHRIVARRSSRRSRVGAAAATPSPASSPPASIYGLPIERVDDLERYIGVVVDAAAPTSFKAHAARQAGTARGAAHSFFSLTQDIGAPHPLIFMQHHRQTVDPLLTWGATTMGDLDDKTIATLEAVNLGYARRLLKLPKSSPVAATLGELGIMRLRERLLVLAVRDMAAVAGLPDDHPTKLGARDNAQLRLAGVHACYHARLAARLEEYDVALPLSVGDMTAEWAAETERRLVSAANDRHVAELIAKQSATPLLLHPGNSDVRLAPYLAHVTSAKGRDALTRLRLGCHDYEVRCGRPLPREDRLCRKCKGAVETEAHALLECDADAYLSTFRTEMLSEIRAADGALPLADAVDATIRLRLLVNHEAPAVLALVARLAVVAERCFKGLPPVNASGFRDKAGRAKRKERKRADEALRAQGQTVLSFDAPPVATSPRGDPPGAPSVAAPRGPGEI